MKLECDLAIVGSGFAGSLLAMTARRQGRSVILLERARHPRFVIGESSTPLGNLLLEELSDRYDLPLVRPLSKWGTWQKCHPQVGCGLKRGFTFYQHRWGDRCATAPDRADQLLVAASPHDTVADTHWYRPDFDLLLAREAERMGARHWEEVQLQQVRFDGGGATLRGIRGGQDCEVRARFVVDASGPRGFLFQQLGLAESPMENLPPTRSVFTHFRGVGRMEEQCRSHSQARGLEMPPYRPDDAALHHIFPGGWIWVLRFNNGITSAGAVAREDVADELGFAEGAAGWQRLLERLPSVRDQFARSEAVLPFVTSPRLAFRCGPMVGERWALLPYAAGFVDPLLSTGFPLTLLGVGRLAEVLAAGWEMDDWTSGLQDYAHRSGAEFAAAERLIAALYTSFTTFELFRSLSLLYFTAATFTESVRRLGHPERAGGFLLHDHPTFGPALRRICDRAIQASRAGRLDYAEQAALQAEVRQAIEPLDVAGLTKRDRQGWYPVDLADLYEAANKVGATHVEIDAMLRRCGLKD